MSAADQNEARQLEVLGAVDRLFSEKVSGENTNDRAQLQEMLIYVRDGDTVRVKSPDRLARSTTDLLALVEHLRARGVAVEFIDMFRVDDSRNTQVGFPVKGEPTAAGGSLGLRKAYPPPAPTVESNHCEWTG